MNKKKYFLYTVLLCLFFACKKEQSMAPDYDYKLFNLENSGWKSKSVSHFLSGIEYKATLVPLQYYILKSVGNKDHTLTDSIFKSHKQERIIEVEFHHENKDDLLKEEYTDLDYESSVKYMSFYIENDFKIVTQSADTIQCAGITFERNFKVAPFKRLLLHFGNVPEDENIQLVYDDRLFGRGFIKFQFNETPIQL